MNSQFIEEIRVEKINDKAYYFVFAHKPGEDVSRVDPADNQKVGEGYKFFVLNGPFQEEIIITGEIADFLLGCSMFMIAPNALLFVEGVGEKFNINYTVRRA